MSLPTRAHISWQSNPAFDDELLNRIKQNLVAGTFYPANAQDIFAAFEMPLDDVRVVIVGLSPYPNINTLTKRPNACGYAFALDADLPYEHWPKSLQVIGDALANSANPEIEHIEQYLGSSLQLWRDQGVLLLNAALTCLHNNPTSHVELWRQFMSKTIDFIDEARPGLIYYFMGTEAKSFQSKIVNLGAHIFSSAHPAFWARNEKAFEDHQFTEIAKTYHWLYGERLDWYLPF